MYGVAMVTRNRKQRFELKCCFFKGQCGLRNNNIEILLISYNYQTFWSLAAKYNDPGSFTTVLEPSNPLFRT